MTSGGVFGIFTVDFIDNICGLNKKYSGMALYLEAKCYIWRENGG